MIDRYSRPEMARIWSDEHRLALWLDVELAVTSARESLGLAAPGTAEGVRRTARVDAARMAEIEAEVRHDVIAFLSMVAESAEEGARELHVGMTSSDLVDTALACQMVEAGRHLLIGVRSLRRVTWDLAQKHRLTPMVGRTHGIHAEPITFGLKLLLWSEELGRQLDRLENALEDVAVGKISGAVGTLAHLGPDVERLALEKLGLRAEPVANQVVQRDRHAHLVCALAVLGGTLDKIALEVRHLQRTEVREAEEPFREGQKGSSAMPHKRNPVQCERICGLARLLRGYAQAALENQALWHERDISHSSVERVILPDAFLVADFMTHELSAVLADLRVYPENMRRNLDAGGGLIHSQRVLLALTSAGMARDEAYRVVQKSALEALDSGGSFRALLEADPRVREVLGQERLAACFELDPAFRHVNDLFDRAEEPVR